MKKVNSKGFTLIEVIVVAGIIAILAGILVPLIFKEIDETKITRASADIRSISSAIIVLRKDIGQWPVNATCTDTVTMLGGAGNAPVITGINWNNSEVRDFGEYLSEDMNNCWPNNWKGPYIARVSADPWGNKYVTNADAFLSTANPLPHIWIISAGPNGIIETAATAFNLSGDDVGMRLR